jgi:hypothetical protein
MKNNNSNKIYGYSDANWAESFDRKSTINFVTIVDEDLVTWKNKKQNFMAQSSAKAEYREHQQQVS